MRKALALLPLLIGALFIASASGSTKAVDPVACTGYNEPRVFADSQAWWVQMPGQTGTNFGHIHTDVCFPFRQHVKGIVPFDIRLTMHLNPGKITKLVIQIGGSGQYTAASLKFGTPLTCSDTCSWWFHLDANTAGFANDGWQEFRIRPTVVEPDGNLLVGSTSYQAYLQNGKPVKNYRDQDFIQGKGWYTGVNYAQARVTGGYTYGAPVSGKWTVKLACDSTSKPVSGCLVTIDPDFHTGNNGIIQFQKGGPYSGSVTVDTTQLTNGPHAFVIRTDVADNTRSSTLGGVLKLPFTVQN